jgi:hypothetical protein
MRTQLTTRGLLRVILCILALGCRVWAGGGFLDDFSDGNIQDDSPVTWQWNADGGQCQVTPDGLQFRPSHSTPTMPGSWLNASAQKYGTDVQYTGNMRIRAQLNIGSGNKARGCVALRLSDTNGAIGGYIFVIIGDSFFFSHASGYFLPSWGLPRVGSYDPQEDVIIQLDAIDITDDQGKRISTRLEGRWWMPGQEMPVEPQIAVIDDKYASGFFGIGAATKEPTSPSPTIFRWVEVTGTEIAAEPIVDFNGDGTVDMKDLLKLIEAWGRNEPAVDIVPDGVVDQKDLEVLMDHWQQDVNDPTLRAHWALDETQGVTATDRMGLGDGLFVGDPTWAPEGGVVNGALELDGDGDAVVTTLVHNPTAGPFSVFAWVKGGAPGQVVVSQANGANWLMADSAKGTLATGLSQASPGRMPLVSESTFTDGAWHRVGFTWDGRHRALYLDDVLVAEDAQDRLADCLGILNLGAGADMRAGSFFSGLIDDVRIYSRAVKP